MILFDISDGTIRTIHSEKRVLLGVMRWLLQKVDFVANWPETGPIFSEDLYDRCCNLDFPGGKGLAMF